MRAAIIFTPATGFTNSDTFTYLLSDGWGAPVTGTVTVAIGADNGPPPTSPSLTLATAFMPSVNRHPRSLL